MGIGDSIQCFAAPARLFKRDFARSVTSILKNKGGRIYGHREKDSERLKPS